MHDQEILIQILQKTIVASLKNISYLFAFFKIKYEFLFSVIMTIALIEIGVFPSQQRGFWCNDSSISYRFQGDSVTPMMLAILTLLSPLFIVSGHYYIFEL